MQRRITITFITLTLLLGPRLGLAQGPLLWQQNLNGTANSFDDARSVAVDNRGNVLAAGRTVNTGTFDDFTVAKFDRNGHLLWQQNLNGTANGSDEARSVAVDNRGNVLAVGFTSNAGASLDFTVAKFDRNGTLLWQQNINGTDPTGSFEAANSVAVDNQGNVLAAGRTQNTGSSWDFTVAKFDRDGTLLWQQNLNGTANVYDEANSVAVDNQGNVLAAGLTQNTGSSWDFTIAKFDRDGTLLWQQNLNGTANGFDEAFSVAVDNQGNVLAAGRTQNTSGSFDFDFTVAKFDRDGTLLWQQNISGTDPTGSMNSAFSGGGGQPRQRARRRQHPKSDSFQDFTVAKFDRNGTLLWQQTSMDTTPNLGDGANSVAVDNQGNVFAAGSTSNAGGSWDFTVAKFDRDGTLLWQENLNGTAPNSGDFGLSVAVDNQGNAFAAGQTENTSTLSDFTVAKFATSPPDQYVEIVSRNSGKCLDVYGASTDAVAPIIQWTCHGGPNQQWRLEPVSDGAVRIIAHHSGQVLDVYGGLVDDVTPIIQFPWHGGDNQRWTVEPASNGYVFIVARHSGKVLDVERGRWTTAHG